MKKIINSNVPYTQRDDLGYRVPFNLNKINNDDAFSYIEIALDFEKLLKDFNLFECLLILLNNSVLTTHLYSPDVVMKNECITLEAVNKTIRARYTYDDILAVKAIISTYRIYGNDPDAYLIILELYNKIKNVYEDDTDIITEVTVK